LNVIKTFDFESDLKRMSCIV